MICHEGGGSLGRDEPLVDEEFAVGGVHGGAEVGEDGVAVGGGEGVEDVAEVVDAGGWRG